MRRALAIVFAAFAAGGLLAPRGSAQPAQVAPVPSSSVKVDESPPPPMPKAPRTLAGWNELWNELPKNTADLRIALAEIERAEAATRIAWGAVLPTLNGSLSLTYNSRTAATARVVANPTAATGSLLSGSVLQAQLAASAVLVNLRAWHQIGTQHVLEEIAHLGIKDVRRRLGLGLARGAASIAAATRIADANRISLDLALQRLKLTRLRLAAGVGDARDLVRAQQDVAASRALIAPADESLLQAQEGLAALLGTPQALGVAVDLQELEQQVRAFCGAPATNPKERLDVVIAKKQIEVAERNVDDITLKFVPTVTAQASAGTFGLAFDGPYTPYWTLGAVLTIPLFDGGVRYGEKRDRLALVEQAKARAVQVEVASLVEKAQARRALQVALAAQTSAKEARDLAAEADRLANLAYAGGVGTNFDLIDAGRRLRDAEAQLVLRDLDVARAQLALPFVEGVCAGTGP